MIARQSALTGPASSGAELDLLDALWLALSSLAERLGLGWGLLLGIILPTVFLAVAGMAMTVWLWRRSSKVPPSTGPGHFIGWLVTVEAAEGTHGRAHVEGTWWSVRSTGAPLRAGDQVRVRDVDGLVLVVEPQVTEAHEQEADEEDT